MMMRYVSKCSLVLVSLLVCACELFDDDAVGGSGAGGDNGSGGSAGGSGGEGGEGGGSYPVLPSVKATKIATGVQFTCALTEEQTVRCWGSTGTDSPGRIAFIPDPALQEIDVMPVPVEIPGITDAIDLDVTYQNGCVVLGSGGVRCWGANGWGQLGNNTRGEEPLTPVDVVGISDAIGVSVGYDHACALRTGGKVSCWGRNWAGQLGFEFTGGDTGFSAVPVEVPFVESATALFAGIETTCAISGGVATCFGSLAFTEGANPSPGEPFELPLTGVTKLELILYQHYAVAGGAAKAWGNDDDECLGNGSVLEGNEVPSDVSGLSSGVTDIDSFCAVQNGIAKCWNELGHLGDGNYGGSSTPVDVINVTDVVAVSANLGGHSCVLTAAGTVHCWGYNQYGELGLGHTHGENDDEFIMYTWRTPQQVLSFE